MLDVPECLEVSTADGEGSDRDSSPVKFLSSIGEYHSDDTCSIGSYQRFVVRFEVTYVGSKGSYGSLVTIKRPRGRKFLSIASSVHV